MNRSFSLRVCKQRRVERPTRKQILRDFGSFMWLQKKGRRRKKRKRKAEVLDECLRPSDPSAKETAAKLAPDSV